MMKIKKILLASALVLSTCGVMAQTQVIAHRGYWKTDGSAQNSIAALLKADSTVPNSMCGSRQMISLW